LLSFGNKGNNFIVMRSILISICCLLFSSCITEYSFDGAEDFDEQYSVNGLIRPGVPAALYIHKVGDLGKMGALPDPSTLRVWITWTWEGEDKLDTLAFLEDRFVGDAELKPNVKYHLNVLLPGGKLIKASTTIPSPAPSYDVFLKFPAGFVQLDNISGPFSRFVLTMPDSLAEAKYYESMLLEVEENDASKFNIQYCRNDDTPTLIENLPSNYLPYFLFQNNKVDKLPMTFNFDNIMARPLTSKFIFRLSSVSEDYFEYKKTLLQHLDGLSHTSEFDAPMLFFPDIFKELQPVYSNIEGAVGIFAGYNPTDLSVTCNLSGYECI